MKNYTAKTFKFYWQHIKNYKLSGFLVVFFIIVASLGNTVAPLYYKKFFDILADTQILEISTKASMMAGVLVKVLLVYAVAWTSWRIASFTMSFFESKIMADLMNSCFAYLHKHSVDYFNNSFVGSLVKKVNKFSRAFEAIADIVFFEVLQIVVSISFIIVVLWQRNIWLGLAVLTWIVIFCLMNYYLSLYKLKYDIERSEAETAVTGVLADTITNHQNVKLFNGYQRENKLFQKTTGHLHKLRLFAWNLSNIFDAIQTLLMIGLEIGMFYFAIKFWQKGILTVGDFVLIQAYLLTIMNRLWNFGRIIRRYYENMSDAKEMTEILDTPHQIEDVDNAKNLLVTRGEIEFKNVSFSYNKTRRIFFNLNLQLPAKKKIALVGPSGSGKSTLVNLILRNYDLGGGKIYIDGQKISNVTQASLHSNISLVPQDPILFHRTLMENIRYAKPEATDEEVIAAAKLANCHDFITNFSEGYQTYVGERGVKLSGGERQRVAIARAILKDAPIIILDEATSSLDSESEELIQDALAKLMSDKTVIVIAHRLSTIIKMDRIIVIKEGKIIEEGNHKELVQKKYGLYNKLWTKQVGGFIN